LKAFSEEKEKDKDKDKSDDKKEVDAEDEEKEEANEVHLIELWTRLGMIEKLFDQYYLSI